MSLYPAPLNWTQSIYNPNNFPSLDDNLTQREADIRYLIKTGADTDIGPLTLKNPLKLADGSVSSPAVQFFNSNNMGLYRVSATTLGLSIGGINKFTWDSTATTSSQTLISTSYQVSNFGGPTAAFGNTTNTQTGMYFPTSNTIGFVQNGNYTLTLASGQIIPFNPIRAQNGSAVVPSYSFGNSADSGLYLLGPNYIGMSIGTDTTQTWEGKSTKFWGSDTGKNAGYVPSGFGYYEELADFNLTWNWGNTQATGSTRITRIGRQVFFQSGPIDFATTPSGSAQWFWVNGQVPTRFRPTAIICFATAWVNQLAGGSDYDTFSCFIDTGGNLTCYQRAFTPKNQKMYVNGFCGSWTL